jgi:hypothetical protein
MMGWGLSAIVALSKLADNLIIHVLTTGGKWTLKAIKELLRPALDPEKVATEEDWQQLVWDKYWVSATDRPILRDYAADLAQQQASPEKVAHILATLERYQDVLKPKASRRRNRAAIATYNLSEEAERKLAHLAEIRGMTPNKLIAELLETAPEFTAPEAEIVAESNNPTPSVDETLEEYRAQIAQMQNQLAAMADEMREAKLSQSESIETVDIEKPTPAPIEWVEATAREIDAVDGAIARSIDVRSALAEVGESTLFLVQRLVKSLKQSAAAKKSDWAEDFAIDESQEIDNWAPA